MKRILLTATVISALALPLFAQSGDAPPVDANQLLQILKQIREANDTGLKTRRTGAYQKVAAAAASNEAAAAFWKEAVKAVQFEGAEKEGSQIRDWKDGDGEALNDKLGQQAVRLHLQWLALTLQHGAGAEMKQQLPQIIEFTKAVLADEAAAEHLADQLDKARERGPTSPGARKNVREDSVVKRVHDQIMRMQISSSPVARWLQLGDLLGNEAPRKGRGNGKDETKTWEMVPGNVDGIYASIILPEFRALKDPRLLESWDMVLKRESDRAAERKLDIEQREWTQVRRPAMLWSRAQDVMILGYKNRAITEMVNILKAAPHHTDAPNWISHIETLLMPPTIAIPAPGAVAPPVVVPPATVPAVPPRPPVR